MKSKVQFRTCRQSDLEQLQILVDALYQEDVDSSSISNLPSAAKPDISLTFEEFSRRPDKGQILVFAADDVDGAACKPESELEPQSESNLEGEICGYAIIVHFWSNEYGGDVNEIDEIYIAPCWRNQGLASSFFAYLEETAPSSLRGWTLQVSKENIAAARLYKRIGFVPCANDYLVCLRSI